MSNLVALIATKPYRYGPHSLKTGDRFEATEKDATMLVRVQMATLATESEPDVSQPKRRYRRKDLQAVE